MWKFGWWFNLPQQKDGAGAHYGIQYVRIKEKVHDTRYQYESRFFYNESTKHCWCFLNFYLAAPQPTLSNFQRDSLTQWFQSLQFLLFQPKGNLELPNEIASLNPVEFELVTFLFLVQCLNPLDHSCKTQKKQETTASFTKHDLSMIKSDCLVVKTVYSSIKCYSRDQICRKRSNITPSFL